LEYFALKLTRVILITLLLPFIALPSLAVDLAGVDVTRYLSTYETLSPTPKGIGHLPRHGNGDTVRIRYALPKKRPFSYKIDFHNIVAYEGNGRGYHLEIRRDSPQGGVIYNGPTTDAASWNFNNVNQVELASVLTSADFARGYLDLYALPTIQGDTWTFYRDADQGEWNLRATALEDTPALRKALQQTRFLREKQIRLLPMPQRMAPAKADFRITSKSRILLCANASSDDRFAASLLRDEIRRLSGLSLSICTHGGIL
jgi:hypothetical protein